jgi:hypothetical protein
MQTSTENFSPDKLNRQTADDLVNKKNFEAITKFRLSIQQTCLPSSKAKFNLAPRNVY